MSSKEIKKTGVLHTIIFLALRCIRDERPGREE
jgi:hypothetical protein